MSGFEGDIIVARVAELPTRDQSGALAIVIAQYLQNRSRPNSMEEVADLAAEVKKKVIEGDFDEGVKKIIAITKQRRLEYFESHKREFAPATKVSKEAYIHGQALDAQDIGHILCTGLISSVSYLRRTLPHVDERKLKQVIQREETRRSYIQQRPYFGHTVFVEKAAVKSDGYGIESVFDRLSTESYYQSWKRTHHCEPWIVDNSEDSMCRHVCAVPFSASGGLSSLLVIETGQRHVSEAQVIHIFSHERTLAAALGHMLPSHRGEEMVSSSPNKAMYFSWQGVKRTVDFS
jgi:hypothetical protein